MFGLFPILRGLLTREFVLEFAWPCSRLNNGKTLINNLVFNEHLSAHVLGGIGLNFGSSHWEQADLIQ